jgi:hypothetical protein
MVLAFPLPAIHHEEVPSVNTQEFLDFLRQNKDLLHAFITELSTRHPYKNDASIWATRNLLRSLDAHDWTVDLVKMFVLDIWREELNDFWRSQSTDRPRSRTRSRSRSRSPVSATRKSQRKRARKSP